LEVFVWRARHPIAAENMLDPEDAQGYGLQQRVRQARQGEIATVCLLVLAFTSTVLFLTQFAGVLVPLIFAVFFSQLFEPILAAIVRAPATTWTLARRLRRHARRCSERREAPCRDGAGQLLPAEEGDVYAQRGDSDNLVRRSSTGSAALPPLLLPQSQPVEAARQTGTSSSTPTLTSSVEPQSGIFKVGVCQWFLGVVQQSYDVLAVIVCTGALLGIIFSIVFGLVQVLEGFDWSKYAKSRRYQEILAWARKIGINIKEVNSRFIIDNFRKQIFETLSGLLSFSEGMVLTLLMFFFCLLAMLNSIHDLDRRRRQQSVKSLMQQYLLYKTLVSVVIGIFVGIALKILKVDLAEIFGLLAFVLNYIPNLGSFIATIAPVPLVALDPSKDLQQVALVVIVPFLIHNTIGCILEPKVMAQGLDLHPLTIVVALTFWGSVWGISGAVLSVPITSVIRLWLEELDHPYAKAVYTLFNAGTSWSAHGGATTCPMVSVTSTCDAAQPLDRQAGNLMESP